MPLAQDCDLVATGDFDGDTTLDLLRQNAPNECMVVARQLVGVFRK